MSTSPAPVFRICHFESPFLPPQPYFCYRNEVCCKDGCCRQYDIGRPRSWQFWYKIYIVLGLIAILLLYRYVCWYCKRKKDGRRATAREGDGNAHVVNLMVSYSGRNDVALKDEDDRDSPPGYNVAVHLPKPHNLNEVPTYEQAVLQTRQTGV